MIVLSELAKILRCAYLALCEVVVGKGAFRGPTNTGRLQSCLHALVHFLSTLIVKSERSEREGPTPWAEGKPKGPPCTGLAGTS